MNTIDQLQQIKILSDPQRLAILRRLMDQPATLSQLGEHFGESPAHIRHHLKALENAKLVELSATHPVRGFLEKYYRATQQAFLIQMTVLPETAEDHPLPVIGSNDPVLKNIFSQPYGPLSAPPCVFLDLDSLEGLVKLREGVCEMATVHLLETRNGEYNRSYISHFFPGEAMALIRLYRRTGGLIVQAGNPLQIHKIEDLARPGVCLINRERGAGTRVWLDYALETLGITRAQVIGYANEAHSHDEVAAAIAHGAADVGIGLPTSALKYGLTFIPLFEEPYDLALSQKALTDPRFSRFFDYISLKPFQERVQSHAGYAGLQDRGQVTLIA